MNKIIKKLLIILASVLVIYAGVFVVARYGWRLFGFDYCESADTVFVDDVILTDESVIISGDTANSTNSYVGYTYKIIDDKLFIGTKYNNLFGFLKRIGAFTIKLKTDTSKINHIYLKQSDNLKEVWKREPENEVQDKNPDTAFDLSNIKKITVFNKSEFDGELVKENIIDNELKGSYNIKLITMDSEAANKFVGSAVNKTELVFWKGHFTGIIENGQESRNVKISNYGGFFSIEGIDGYFEIADEYREEWDSLVRDFQYVPDISNFTYYNKLIEPNGENDPMGHLILSFSAEENFILCMHKPTDGITTEAIRKLLKWKYDSDVVLKSYLHTKEPHDNIKLLYEDGTYFEWDYSEHTKYLCTPFG